MAEGCPKNGLLPSHPRPEGIYKYIFNHILESRLLSKRRTRNCTHSNTIALFGFECSVPVLANSQVQWWWGGWMSATREGHQCPPVTSEPDNHRSVAELGGSAITTLLVGSHYWWCGGQFSHFGPPPPRAAGFSQRHTDPGQIQSSWANLGLIFPANCKLFRQRFCYYVWWANANYPSRFKISPFQSSACKATSSP